MIKALFLPRSVVFALFLIAVQASYGQITLPPDSLLYQVRNESGVDVTVRRSPDSLMIQNYIIVRFNEGVLNYNKLLDTYEDYYYSFKQKGKQEPQSGGAPFPSDTADERGFPDTLRYMLMTEKFCLNNPSSNIILSPELHNFLVMAGATCIQRLTTASP